MVVFICLTAMAVWSAFFLRRSDFGLVAVHFSLFFLFYGYILHHWTRFHPVVLLALGLVLRLIFLGGPPLLSEDAIRFIWDGRLLLHGFHPFSYTPREWVALGHSIPGLEPALLTAMNSANFHTVYPPMSQLIFWVAAVVSPVSVAGGIGMLKLFLLLAECGVLVLLVRLYGRYAAAIYWLNPLVLVEVMGNAHFEGLMLAFFLLGWWHMRRGWWRLAAWWIALSVATKLVTLLFLPVLWAYLGWRRGFIFCLFTGIFSLVFFIPLLDAGLLEHLAGSLGLYFQHFQFNASVYYLVEWLVWLRTGWTQGALFAPLLALVVVLLAGWIAWNTAGIGRRGRFTPEDGMVWCCCCYLFFSSTVHPWYVLLPMGISVGSRRWQFPVIWSAVVWVSYSHYSGGAFREQVGWIIFEYAVVLVGVGYEWWRGRSALSFEGNISG
jgi:hypothetical protein